MSKLNPNAGEFVPSFSAPAPASTAGSTAGSTGVSTPSARSPVGNTGTAASPAHSGGPPASPAVAELPQAAAASVGGGVDEFLEEDGVPISYEGYSPIHGRYIYSKEYLLAFKSVCDRQLSDVPDVVRNPAPPQKLGRMAKGRLTYTLAELLEFQPLYQMMPDDFTWADTLGADAVVSDKKGKAKNKKDKNRLNGMLSYDASLACYFNPTEYAAAIGLYTGPPEANAVVNGQVTNGVIANGSATVSPVEEAVIAKRRFAPLLDDVRLDTVNDILTAVMEIPVTCTSTLQELIDLLFDHAIAEPALSESYAQLCSGIAERTPEFKDGAKTVNFRRLLLTKCYETLIEEPESASSNQPSGSTTSGFGSFVPAAGQHHSWRRQCMLRNVGLVGELFRRQLLTENIMHVCVAMMLDDESTPEPEVIKAACGLLTLVGDLLDGSSPASRRTMDEYFVVLSRIRELKTVPAGTKDAIAELANVRANGWAIKKADIASPAKASAPVSAVDNQAKQSPAAPSGAV